MSTRNASLEPTWHAGMYGAPQDMYGASVVLPLLARLEAAEMTSAEDQMYIKRMEAERDAALALIAAYKVAGDDVKRACPECEGEGVVLVAFTYGTVEIECEDCNATGVAK